LQYHDSIQLPDRKIWGAGRKTGWTYILIPAEKAQQLKPGNKRSFRIKGKFDKLSVKQIALIPMVKATLLFR